MISIPTTALQTGAAALGGLFCAIPAIFFIIAIVIAIWVYKDAEKRGKSGAMWLIIVLITGIIGLIVWLVVRPDMSEVRRQQQQQQQYQQGPPPSQGQSPQQQQQQAKPCPDCGGQMRYVDQYDKWYCDQCGEYK